MQRWILDEGITHLDSEFNVIDGDNNIKDLEPKYSSYWDWIWGVVSDWIMDEIRQWLDVWILEISSDFDEKDIDERTYPVKSATPMKLLTHFT